MNFHDDSQPKIENKGFEIKPFYAEENQLKTAVLNSHFDPYRAEKSVFEVVEHEQQKLEPEPELADFKYLNKDSFIKSDSSYEKNPQKAIVKPSLRVIGELFKTYILCESGENMILMDKHAAHERINFEKMKDVAEKEAMSAQYIAFPEKIKVDESEYTALFENQQFLLSCGLDVSFFENFEVQLNSLPSMLDLSDGNEILLKLANILSQNNYNAVGTLLGDLLHSMSCKASVRANDGNKFEEIEYLANKVFHDERIRFCPHGRPIMTVISKTQLEKYFGRIQS